jgi:hypothetical protein
MVLRIIYKEIKEIISSKVIIIEGILLNTGIIKTVSIDSK